MILILTLTDEKILKILISTTLLGLSQETNLGVVLHGEL